MVLLSEKEEKISHQLLPIVSHLYKYTAIVIIIATNTAAKHSMTTATDTPIATDD